MLLKYILIFLIIVSCNGIREDYFVDTDEQNAKESKEDSASSMLLQYLKVQDNATNSPIESNLVFANESKQKKFDDNYYDANENMVKNNITVGKRLYNDEYNTYIEDDAEYDKNLAKVFNISKVNALDTFKDYVYSYVEPMTADRQALRKIDAQTALKTNRTATSSNISKLIHETNKKIMIDFYNLQPAGNKLVIDLNQNSDGNQMYPKRVWYVPENLPCWELPILYGEFGESKKRHVFLRFGSRLKNVIEKHEEEKVAPKKLNIPISQAVNKWCTSDPCYGDHTLCLFPQLINSKLCMNDYEVQVPSMVSRIALVNTVNSMRNRVATGVADLYKHLPTAADMNQIIYDFDLQAMSQAWLRQCLPGPSACSSLEGNYVSQLECTKYTEHCCINAYRIETGTNCIPHPECFIDAIIGCILTWFRSAKDELTATDVKCGHITPNTFHTVQLLWAETNKIGCAYGSRPRGDVRVVCNFSPGAPFSIATKSFCGFLKHKEIIETTNVTSHNYLIRLGIALQTVKTFNITDAESNSGAFNHSLRLSDVDILSEIYPRGWVRQELNENDNGTLAFIARLVTKYTFGEESGPQCDTNNHIYEPGEAGSMCVEIGSRFSGLCYDFRDPTPGYRLVAVLAPIALFSLILYDLFSRVVRQTNC